MMNRLQVL